MAEPTSRFRLIPQTTAAADIDAAAKRLAEVSGQSVCSTGAGNEANFGTIDISAGAANSSILTLFWDITADGGNTLAENFRWWLSSNGFDMAGSVCKFQPLSGADQAAPSATENYVANSAIGDYTWATMPEEEPITQNLYPSDEGSGMVLNVASDDVLAWAMYLAIAESETTGSYAGTTADFELQFSLKYAYS